ncbi:MAG TPA: ATP-binding protein, partial [Anaerolineaceae bacterium]
LEPKVRANLELVQSEISRLNRFVETILDLNALDAGRLPLYLAPVPYDSIVAILQSQLLHLPGGERILWEMPAALPTLNADERALTSVLFHLIDNALKYAPTGAIRIAAGIDGSQARIQVLDSGPGIPPEAMPLLFDRFYRLNAEDSQTVYGHGLGLYIVRRLVEAMGGRVEAGNRPEGGAVFTVWLRLAEETEESHAL